MPKNESKPGPVKGITDPDHMRRSALTAERRANPEGQQGLKSFLEKRKPDRT